MTEPGAVSPRGCPLGTRESALTLMGRVGAAGRGEGSGESVGDPIRDVGGVAVSGAGQDIGGGPYGQLPDRRVTNVIAGYG